jgi:hypothetical protein
MRNFYDLYKIVNETQAQNNFPMRSEEEQISAEENAALADMKNNMKKILQQKLLPLLGKTSSPTKRKMLMQSIIQAVGAELELTNNQILMASRNANKASDQFNKNVPS